jgi:hypothetical protein
MQVNVRIMAMSGFGSIAYQHQTSARVPSKLGFSHSIALGLHSGRNTVFVPPVLLFDSPCDSEVLDKIRYPSCSISVAVMY